MNFKLHPADYNKHNSTLGLKLPTNSIKSDNISGIFNMSNTTEDQAVSNYVNLLLTKPGERYMQPEFGVGLYLYIFENNTTELAFLLKTKIEEQASMWLPYIINDDILIKDYYEQEGNDKQGINIIIKFRATESGANKTISAFPGNDSVDIILN